MIRPLAVTFLLVAIAALRLAQIDTSAPAAVNEGEVHDGSLDDPEPQKARDSDDVVTAPQQPPKIRDSASEDRDEEVAADYDWQKVQAVAEIGLLLLAAIGGFFVFLQLVAIFLQLGAMKESNRITQESNRITEESTKKTLHEAAVESFFIQREMAESNALLRESNALTRDNLIVGHRAWVTVTAVKAELHSGPISVHLKVQNTGNTPATNLYVWVEGHTLDSGEELAKNFRVAEPPAGVPPSIAVLSPNRPADIVAVTPMQLTEKQLSDIANDDLKLYVAAVVSYKDVFRQKRETRFCARYVAPKVWEAAERGNSIA